MKVIIRRSRKRILIVNACFDELRGAVARPRRMPMAMGPAYLAGACNPKRCHIRLYNEGTSGPLHDADLLGWPDMLVLTSLTSGLDRMRHLAAYARTQNPRVVVVAGGPAIRALPRYARPFFDYACLGDVEELGQVLTDAFGPGYAAAEMRPRLDLAHWLGLIGHAESSRNCNFNCAFCSIAGEGRGYLRYSLDDIRRQILALGRRKVLLLIDQNFYGNDRNFFLARLELLRELRAAGCFESWTALVTNDFFYRDDNLEEARKSGCIALFSGVESLDPVWLRSMNKLQNVRENPAALIRKSLDAGIVFLYGLMLDVTSRPLADLRRELDFITGSRDLTLPAFVTPPIPIPGTAYFTECLERGLLLPDTRLRDLDGATLALRPLGSLAEAARFVADIQTLRGWGARVLRHSAGFLRRYAGRLSPFQFVVSLSGGLLTTLPVLTTARGGSGAPRAYVSSSEPLDPLFRPALPVAAKYEHYFRPTMVTDSAGGLSEDLAELAPLSRAAAR